MLVGDFNVEPTKIPCLAKGISAGLWVDLEASWALASGVQPASTCKRAWGASGGHGGTLWWVVPCRTSHTPATALLADWEKGEPEENDTRQHHARHSAARRSQSHLTQLLCLPLGERADQTDDGTHQHHARHINQYKPS